MEAPEKIYSLTIEDIVVERDIVKSEPVVNSPKVEIEMDWEDPHEDKRSFM